MILKPALIVLCLLIICCYIYIHSLLFISSTPYMCNFENSYIFHDNNRENPAENANFAPIEL